MKRNKNDLWWRILLLAVLASTIARNEETCIEHAGDFTALALPHHTAYTYGVYLPAMQLEHSFDWFPHSALQLLILNFNKMGLNYYDLNDVHITEAQ